MAQPIRQSTPLPGTWGVEEKGAQAKGKFCIVNVNDHGRLYLMMLKARGRVSNYYFAGNARWCAEFTRELELDLTDYEEILPKHLLQREYLRQQAMESFRTYIILEAMHTLENAEVIDFNVYSVVFKPQDEVGSIE